jgi:[ribosomal protein S5]-alanine N-acetyltransferase
MDILFTPRLVLRRARADDLSALHEILSNPEAMRYWDTLAHTSLEQTREWLGRMMDENPDETDDYIIEHHGKLIGKCGLWRMPEIGFILHPHYWGQGIAYEALSAVIAHVFTKFDIDTVVAEADPRNSACLSLLKKLNFSETRRAERTIKVGEEWCDSIYLALTRPKA